MILLIMIAELLNMLINENKFVPSYFCDASIVIDASIGLVIFIWQTDRTCVVSL